VIGTEVGEGRRLRRDAAHDENPPRLGRRSTDRLDELARLAD
jgi:hypothetical protein